MDFVSSIIAKLINADMIGGWVRAAVGAGFVLLIAKFPIFAFITPETQVTIAAAISTFVVGFWQQIAKQTTAPTTTQAIAVTSNLVANNVIPASTVSTVASNPDLAKGVI